MTVQPAPDETRLAADGPLLLVRRPDGTAALRLGTAAVAVGTGFVSRCVGPHPLDRHQIDTLTRWLAAHAPLVDEGTIGRLLGIMVDDADAVLSRHTPWTGVAAMVAVLRRPHAAPCLCPDIEPDHRRVGALYDTAMALSGLDQRALWTSRRAQRLVLAREPGGLVVHYRSRNTPATDWPRLPIEAALATGMIWPITLSARERRQLADWRAERRRDTACPTPSPRDAVA